MIEMTTFDFITSDANVPFLTALTVMLAFMVLEILALALGGNPVDGAIPDFADIHFPEADMPDIHVPEAHANFHLEASDAGIFGVALGWLHVGRVPILVLLALALGGFSIGGLVTQWGMFGLFGAFLSPWLASVPAVITALVSMRVVGGLAARVLPRDETTAVSSEQFLGQVATIHQGVARFDLPAEATLLDGHGRTHYVQVAPVAPGEVFELGAQVLLISREDVVFRAVRPEGPLV